jgi:glycerophosphoryl diester phosphodiesterase
MFLRIGHRGAPHAAPENSLAGFKAALTYSPDMVEMDVRVSKDGTAVIMHDEKVDRTTDGRGKVIRMTLKDLRVCKLANGEPVPTLAEALDLLKGLVDVKIDVKDVGIEDVVVHELRRVGVVRQAVVIAYGRKALAAFKNECPSLRTEVGGVYSRHQRGSAITSATQTGAEILSVRHAIVTAKFAKECVDKNLAIHAWTINDRPTAERLHALGVAAVATDRLDLV